MNSQRDHNRATLNFNISIGGSDSDTSSGLSVRNPLILGSVGDSPRGSTSSSVRDLPCSSTSPASNQEQSSPEEFCASPDSGLGGSEVYPEIESPPTQEGDPVEKESSISIYQRHMCLEGHGFPLWIPQPNMRLPRSYRRQGVSIGDVGIFAWDGSFDFLFNVCLPAGHPNNPVELPEGFTCLVLRPADVSEVRAHSSHSHMASTCCTSIQKQGEKTFECSGSDGAVLIMPQGAYHENLQNISRFKDYASIHVESWYQYANGPSGREIDNGKLHMVTGCDKTTAWGIATYSHLQSKRPEGSVTLLSFDVVGDERYDQQPSYPTYAWNYKGIVEAKVGPEEDELMDLGVQGSAPPRNQCTFIRSLTLKLGHDGWERLQLKVAASKAKERASAQPPKNSAISSLPGGISSFRGHSRGGNSEVTDSMTPAQTTATHPATYVINMILRKCPTAKVVVVHDNDWCSVIRDSDVDWTCTAQDLPRRIQEAFHIVEEKNGTVYLEEKARPLQDLRTSSGVSVRAEVEDRPLLGNRKLWPSQLFDLSETSPSDMEVDSPRSFKKTFDDNEDIRFHTCHGSGEDDDNDFVENFLLLEDRKQRSSQNFDSFEISYSKPPGVFKSFLASPHESNIEESADDVNDDAKSDLFEDSTQANLNYLEGKLVRRDAEFHIQAPSDDEIYHMSHDTLPVPTSQTYEWQNADGGDVMPHNNFSSSSGRSASHLLVEEEFSRGIVRGRLSLSPANSSNRHDPESSTQLHETLEDLEPGNAAGVRDHIMSDSAPGTEYGAPISDLLGTDPLAEKVLPLAHSQSAGATHPRTTIATQRQRAASKERGIDGNRFQCPLCPQTFTAKHNLKNHMDGHLPGSKKTHHIGDFTTPASLLGRRKGLKTNPQLKSALWSNELKHDSSIETERPMSGAAPRGDE